MPKKKKNKFLQVGDFVHVVVDDEIELDEVPGTLLYGVVIHVERGIWSESYVEYEVQLQKYPNKTNWFYPEELRKV